MKMRLPVSVAASLVLSCFFANSLAQTPQLQIAQQQGALTPSDQDRSVMAQQQEQIQLRDRLEHDRQLSQQREITERADAEIQSQARVTTGNAAQESSPARQTPGNEPPGAPEQRVGATLDSVHPASGERPDADRPTRALPDPALLMRAIVFGILIGLCAVLPAMFMQRRFRRH